MTQEEKELIEFNMTTENKTLDGIHERIIATEEFILRNRFTLNRTQEEMLERIKTSDSFFGFDTEVFIGYLTWENAKQFYKDEFATDVLTGKATPPRQITSLVETVQDMDV